MFKYTLIKYKPTHISASLLHHISGQALQKLEKTFFFIRKKLSFDYHITIQSFAKKDEY